ncbi:hypothetical protein F7D09_0802 [Bifidobacterium leontopitheci]|uniref:Uncharacterized protein n=1 Tax=Bifidobacterium leontopitheci TaxID=2650774 RepID=A0A6I1GM79_9BIFI|nr:hypothetical protein F7D09_0802 [Bifidobacterium leontopitheci]
MGLLDLWPRLAPAMAVHRPPLRVELVPLTNPLANRALLMLGDLAGQRAHAVRRHIVRDCRFALPYRRESGSLTAVRSARLPNSRYTTTASGTHAANVGNSHCAGRLAYSSPPMIGPSDMPRSMPT